MCYKPNMPAINITIVGVKRRPRERARIAPVPEQVEPAGRARPKHVAIDPAHVCHAFHAMGYIIKPHSAQRRSL